MTTVNDLIVLSLKAVGAIGAGQTPAYEDSNDAFTILNMMMGEWSSQRWLMYNQLDTGLVSTGAATYTVGPGGDYNIVRPDKLGAAYVRLLNSQPIPADFPLGVITSMEDWSAVCLKTLTTFPIAVFLDTNYPMGTLHVWPVAPADTYEIHIITHNPLSQFTGLTETIALPPEYFSALLWNLAARLGPIYKLPPDPTVIALARTSLTVIRGANTQIPTLSLPSVLLPRRGGYDPTLGSLNGLPFSF